MSRLTLPQSSDSSDAGWKHPTLALRPSTSFHPASAKLAGKAATTDAAALTEASFEGGKIVYPIAFSLRQSAPALSAPKGRRRQLRFERCHDGGLTDFHLWLAADDRSRRRIHTDPQDTSTKAV